MYYLPVFVAMSLLAMTGTAHAYLGPGMGAGAVTVVLGIVAAFFMSLFAVIWYPFKRMLNRRKGQKTAAAPAGGDTDAA